MKGFIESFEEVAEAVHANAVDKGWWDEDRNNGELIALIHSELSEALEGLRKGNEADEHCPAYTSVEVELADAVIRIMDMAKARGWRVSEAIIAKMIYNTGRPYRHGKKF